MPGRFATPVADAGFTYREIGLSYINKGVDPSIPLGEIEGDISLYAQEGDYTANVVRDALVRLRGMPSRGELAKVKVMGFVNPDDGYSPGDLDYEVFVLDRSQEGLFDLNILWSSDLVTTVTTQMYTAGEYGYSMPYGYGYSESGYQSMDVRRLYQHAIGVPYMNRSGDAEVPELYLRIVSNIDAMFYIKVGAYAVA